MGSSGNGNDVSAFGGTLSLVARSNTETLECHLVRSPLSERGPNVW
jgi:hypothetical protein